MKLPSALSFFVGLLAITFFTSIYYFLFSHIPSNADAASYVLQAQDLLQGNTFLKGWYMPADNYYSLDLVFYLIAFSLFGLKYFILHLVPAVIYALVVCTTIGIAWCYTQNEARYFALILLFIFLIFPSWLMLQMISMSPVHLVTTLYTLFIFLLLRRDKNNNFSSINYSIALLLLILVNVGDPLSLVITTLPIMVVSIISAKINRYYSVEFSIALLALMLAFIVKTFLSKYGFTEHFPPLLTFATLAQFGQNIYYYFEGLLLLLDADFFGQSITSSYTLIKIINALLVTGLLFNAVIESRRIFRNPNIIVKNPLTYYCLAALYFCVLSCLFSNYYVNQWSLRYLIPGTIFLIIFSILNLPTKITFHKNIIMGGLIFGLLTVVSHNMLYHHEFKKINLNSTTSIITVLQNHHLTYGFGGYWYGSMISVYSAGEILIRPIAITSDGYLQQNYWLSKEAFYEPTSQNKAHFVIVDQDDKTDLAGAIKTFGNPDTQINTASQTILIWKNDITPLLHKE